MKSNHRPWPIPNKPWRFKQTWHDLLFAHWPVDANYLRPFVPEYLTIETFHDKAWIGVVSFQTSHARARLLPYVPFFKHYNEINIRTYVRYGNTPGVFFFSMNISSPIAATFFHKIFRLPYYYSKIHCNQENDCIQFQCSKTTRNPIEMDLVYEPTTEAFQASNGTLEHWLTERYCFYTTFNKTLFRAEILHEPWQLQQASAEIRKCEVAQFSNDDFLQQQPIFHYAKKQEVLSWGLENVLKLKT